MRHRYIRTDPYFLQQRGCKRPDCGLGSGKTGERYRLPLDAANSFLFDFGPADSLLIVFDKQKRGNDYKPLPVSGEDLKDLSSDWDVEFRHSREEYGAEYSFRQTEGFKGYGLCEFLRNDCL